MLDWIEEDEQTNSPAPASPAQACTGNCASGSVLQSEKYEDDDEKERNCEALWETILKTCALLTGEKRNRCEYAAYESFRQCMDS